MQVIKLEQQCFRSSEHDSHIINNESVNGAAATEDDPSNYSDISITPAYYMTIWPNPNSLIKCAS